jgi:hypothetical protein
MQQANPLLRDVSLFAHVHGRLLLSQKTGFVGIFCHMLNGNQLLKLRGLPTVEFLR